MISFTCVCGWQYIIGKKKVYGPIWHRPPCTSLLLCGQGRMMTREQFKEEYADCAYRFKLAHGKL